jgi:CheY-like chemotaxis protein
MEQLRPLRVLIASQQNTLDRVMATTIRHWGHESIVLPLTESLHESEVSAVGGDVLVYDVDRPLRSTSACVVGKETCISYQRSSTSAGRSPLNSRPVPSHEDRWRKLALSTRFTIVLSSRSVSRTMLEEIGAIALLYKPFEMGRLQRYLRVLQRLVGVVQKPEVQPLREHEKARVLVVDDDVSVAHAIRQCLLYGPAQKLGYEVAVAHDGLEALEYCVDWHPHCIVTDLIMPWMNGYQVMRCLAVGSLPVVPTFVVMSALARFEGRLESSYLGEKVVAYITKPFHIDYLLAAIQKGCAG